MADNQKQDDNEKGKHARYLVNPDTTHVELVTADKVEDNQKAGWVDPTSLRANGYVYNREEDQGTTDAAGASLELHNKMKAEKAKKADDERKKVADANEVARKAQVKADKEAEDKDEEGFFSRIKDRIEGEKA